MPNHTLNTGVFQIVALESSPKWRGQGEVIKKRQFEIHPSTLFRMGVVEFSQCVGASVYIAKNNIA
jgi:hypothetical protein